MPEITRYTRERLPSQLIGAQASPADFGAIQTGAQAQSRSMREMSAAFGEIGETINRVNEKRQSRLDVINRTRSLDAFQNDSLAEFTKISTEEDLIDPETSKAFNTRLRTRAEEVISNFQGSEDARAALLREITGFQSQLTQKMNALALGAQQDFIMDRASKRINELSSRALNDPSQLGNIFLEADNVIDEFGPALYPEDETALLSAAQEQIAISALQSFTDSGRYDEAKELIESNPMFLQALSPEKQRAIVRQIKSGIQERERVALEMRNRIGAIRSAAEELGVSVPPAQLFASVTGIDSAASPADKVEQFAALAGKDITDLSPSVIAKIGFGADLPGQGEIDFNKEFTPTGDLTPKGISGKIKAPFERAAAIKTYQDKVDGGIKLFRENGNSQALLSAMITFQKALDDGAIVREGDIILQRSAQGLADQIKGTIARIETGQPVGGELVDQMALTMRDFTTKALTSEKALIDPFLEEADKQGYRRINVGLPRESYESVFGGVIQLPSGGTKDDPMSVRNNNPGNLRPVGSASGFVRYETPQEGINALQEDLEAKINGKSPAMKDKFGDSYVPTIENLISVYAPDTENDTSSYVDFVSEKLGVDKSYTLKPEDIKRLVPAIIEFEGGQRAVDYFSGAGLDAPKRFRVGIDGKIIGRN